MQAIYTRPDLCALLRADDEPDISYYQTVTADCADVLDLGCGFGRVSLAIAPGKRRVVGVDPSHDMLAEFRARLAAAPADVRDVIEVVTGTMEHVALSQRFDAAIVPFSSFTYMLTPARQRACLATSFAHLRPGGLFAMDMMDAEAARAAPTHIADRGTIPLPAGDAHFEVAIAREIDEAAQLVRESIAIDFAPGSPITGGRFHNTYRFFTPDEIRRLAGEAGFTVAAVYRDYARTPYTPGELQVWELRKPC